MAHKDFEPRAGLNGFQHEITYAVPHLAPEKIVPTTNGMFDLYFKGVELNDTAGQVVMKDSVQFLVNARKGLSDDPFLIERMLDTPYRDLMNAINMEGVANTPPDESRQAAAFSIIAMGVLPRTARVFVRDFENKPVRFRHASTGILGAPRKVADLTERFDELIDKTGQVADGSAPRSIHIFNNPGLLRTREYWKAGTRLVSGRA